jgi:hypothetical protein
MPCCWNQMGNDVRVRKVTSAIIIRTVSLCTTKAHRQDPVGRQFDLKQFFYYFSTGIKHRVYGASAGEYSYLWHLPHVSGSSSRTNIVLASRIIE